MVRLNTLSNASSELHIRLHDCDAFCMLSTHLSVNKEVDQIVLSGLLHGLDGETLETDIVLVVVGNQLTHKLGEGQFTDQKLSGLLIFLDFTGGNCALLRAASLLHTTSCTCSLAGSFTGDRLAGCFGGAGRFTSCVLCASHFIADFMLIQT